MISHKYKCIFVHIPRCAGTSIETWIVGEDWWDIEPSTKHILASQARKLYSRYWDKYFKFAFVRNPYTRAVSCAAYNEFYRYNIDKHGNIDFSDYLNIFGNNITIEYDYRFYKRSDVERKEHQPKQIYGNFLDVPVDKIFRFEDLESSISQIADIIGLDAARFPRAEASHRPQRALYLMKKFLRTGDLYYPKEIARQIRWNRRMPNLNDVNKKRIFDIYEKDFERFGYAK